MCDFLGSSFPISTLFVALDVTVNYHIYSYITRKIVYQIHQRKVQCAL